MDVIALHQAGFDSAVASLGTSLTEEQARIIARHLLPNTLSVVIVRVTLSIPSAIFSEAYLSYIGLGIPLPMSIYEATGVFQNVFVFGFIVDIVIIALVILAKKSSRTLRWLSE